jgi:hypothetical protein
MINQNRIFNSVKMGLHILATSLLFSCNSSKWIVPGEYVGEWQAGHQKITVRTHSLKTGYQFTSDSVTIKIIINENKTVSGTIGMTAFENVSLKKNSGNPKITGISYIVRCGKIGKIFTNDPLDLKEVELWLSPIKENMNAELRYTEGLAVFPMAGFNFIKVKK